MNKIRKSLIVMLSALCLVCFGLFAAACTDDKPETETYTVTLEYDATKGTVTKSPEKDAYNKDETVTITVEPLAGYEVEVFTVSTDSAATLTEGSYTLTVTANTTVSVTFKELGVPTGTFAVDLEYDATKGTVMKFPNLDAFTPGTEVMIHVEANEGYGVDTFTVSTDANAELDEEGNYTLIVPSNDTTVTVTFSEVEVPPDLPPVTFSEDFIGTWVSLDGKLTIVITENSLTVDGELIEGVAELMGFLVGYRFVWKDTDCAIYFEDDLFTLEQSGEDMDTLYTKFLPEGFTGDEVTFDEAYIGTWTSEDGTVTVVISENELTYNGATAIVLESWSGYTLIANGTLYILELNDWMYDSAILVLTDPSTWDSVELFKEGGNVEPEITFGADYIGTWVSIDGTITLVITEHTLTINGDFIEGVTENLRLGGYLFTLDGYNYAIYFDYSGLFTLEKSGDDILTQTIVFLPEGFTGIEVTFGEAYIGTWVTEDGEHTIVFTETEMTYDGEKAIIIEDFWGYSIVVGGKFYSVFIDDYTYDYVVLVLSDLDWNETEFFKEGGDVVPDFDFDPDYVGTWVSLDGELTIVITEHTLTIGGDVITEIKGEGGYLGYAIVWNGADYEIAVNDILLSLLDEDYKTTMFLPEGFTGIEATFGEEYIGTWKGENGDLLVFTEHTVTLNDVPLMVIADYGAWGYAIVANGQYYAMYIGGYEYPDALVFADLDYNETPFYKEGSGETIELPEWLLGTSYLNLEGWGLLTIDEKGVINWMDTDLELLAFEESKEDILSNHFTATVSLEGTLYTLEGSDTGFTATNTDDGITTVFNFVALAKSTNAAYQGTWETAGGDMSVEITATTVNYGGMEFTTFAYDGYALYVDSGMGIWTLSLYESDSNVLLVTVSSYGYTITAAYVKQGANVGVDGIDWAGLVGTWQTASGETLTINKDGSAVWAGHTVIVLSTKEVLIGGKTDYITFIIDSDLVETMVEIVDGVPGELVIYLSSEDETYTFTKTAEGGGEEGDFSFANTVWTYDVWKFSFDGISGIDIYQNGNYYKWVSDLTIDGTTFSASYLDDDGMEALIYGELSEDGNSIKVNWMAQGFFGVLFTKEGGEAPVEDIFAGTTWEYGTWKLMFDNNGWVDFVQDGEFKGTRMYTVTSTGFECIDLDDDGMEVTFMKGTLNEDGSLFVFCLDLGLFYDFTKVDGGSDDPGFEKDPNAAFLGEHVGTWISEDGLDDLILNADGTVVWGNSTGELYISYYDVEFGAVYYTVYFNELAMFASLMYWDGELSVYLEDLGMEYYFTMGATNPLADFVGTWNAVVEAGTLGYQLVITEEEIKVVGEDIQSYSFSIGEWDVITVKIVAGDATYTYELFKDSDYLIYLEASNGDVLYFLKDNAPTLKVSSDLAGTWVAASAAYKLVISADGSVSYGPDFGTVVGTSDADGWRSYRVLFGTTLAVIDIDPSGALTLTYGDGYYEMSKEVREAVYVPEAYRNKTYSGDGHTLVIDADGNVSIDEVLCELTSVQDWGYPYCTLVWDGVEWTIEIEPYGGNYVQLYIAGNYDVDWIFLYVVGGEDEGVAVPAELLGTTWTGKGTTRADGSNMVSDCTIVLKFTADGITISINGVEYSVTLVSVTQGDEYNQACLELLLPGNGAGDESYLYFTSADGSFGAATSVETMGCGYIFTLTKNA